MAIKDKNELTNALVVALAEKYDLKISELKSDIAEVLKPYHISHSDQAACGTDFSTIYLMTQFEKGKMSAGMSEKTVQQYRIAVNVLEKYSKKQLSEIEPDDFRDFLISYREKYSSVTVRNKYNLLASVYNWLYKRDYIPFNPIPSIDSPKSELIIKQPLSDIELESIKKTCESFSAKESERDMALIYFFTSTGVRVSELCKIKIKDLDLEKGSCKIMGKGGKERFVYLSDKALFRIKTYLSGRTFTEDDPLFSHLRKANTKLSKDGVENIVHKIRKLSGISRLTCHVFRRFYATELRKRNVNIQMIAKSLGHANLNQINRYSLYSENEMQNVIKQAM